MTFNWDGKRRWIALLLVIAGVIVMINWKPVLPVIQLPGEVYPVGQLFGLSMTNTLMGSILVWILIGLLIYYVARSRPEHGGETPRGGFYNMFELLFEGLYGFIGGIAPAKYLDTIFKMFMTIFIIVLLSNWMELVPGVDAIGFLEPHVHTTADGHQEVLPGYEVSGSGIYTLNGKCAWVGPDEAATYTEDQMQARKDAGCVTGTGEALPVMHEAAAAQGTSTEAPAEATEVAASAESSGGEAAAATTEGGQAGEEHLVPGDPSVPWVVLPFVRAPSTDLNLTAALALIAVVSIQIMGFRALGPGYLTKFFNFGTLFTSPLGGIDVAVGLLELIGEFAKILSFAFRLLGNIFAGSILLFVMSFLVPALVPWPFFLLEFFVGIIQAIVFGMLTAIFMSLATVGHHSDAEHVEQGVEDELEAAHA